MALKATGAQLAAVLENARLLMDLQRMCSIPERPADDLRFIKGQSASGGFAFARATIWGRSHGRLVGEPDVVDSGTLIDFLRAVKKTGEQLNALQQRCAERLPESAALIFAAHFMMLKDPKFIDRMKAKIEKGDPASRAVREVARYYLDLFADSPHPYIREKVSDIEDLAGRLLKQSGAAVTGWQWGQHQPGRRRPGALPIRNCSSWPPNRWRASCWPTAGLPPMWPLSPVP